MKKVLIVALSLLVLVACGEDEYDKQLREAKENLEKAKEDTERIEETSNQIDETSDLIEEAQKEMGIEEDLEESEKLLETTLNELNEAQKELYMKMLNNLINEFDDEYDNFDTKAAISLYNFIFGISQENAEVARDMKDEIIESTDEENRDIYSEFYDRTVELMDLFPDIDWSDD